MEQILNEIEVAGENSLKVIEGRRPNCVAENTSNMIHVKPRWLQQSARMPTRRKIGDVRDSERVQ